MDAITMLKTDHDKVKDLLAELESTTERGVKTRQELFATIKGELSVHEVIEEEEGEMFKQARQVFDRQELEDLGARMARRKETAQRELGVPVTR